MSERHKAGREREGGGRREGGREGESVRCEWTKGRSTRQRTEGTRTRDDERRQPARSLLPVWPTPHPETVGGIVGCVRCLQCAMCQWNYRLIGLVHTLPLHEKSRARTLRFPTQPPPPRDNSISLPLSSSSSHVHQSNRRPAGRRENTGFPPAKHITSIASHRIPPPYP